MTERDSRPMNCRDLICVGKRMARPVPCDIARGRVVKAICLGLVLSSVLAPATVVKIMLTRLSSCPVFSSAITVLSKVGADGLFAILSTSANCCLIPSSKAGKKSLSFNLSKGGA